MTNPIDPFQSEKVVSGVLQAQLEEIIAEMVLEEDASAVLGATDLNDSAETLADSDLVLATFATPRALTITPSETLMGPDTVTINGLDADGEVLTEDFDYDSDTVVAGTALFASITSVVLPAFTTDSDDAISIGWNISEVESQALQIPGGQANLQFYVKSSEESSAGVLGIEWYVSWDNVEWFELTESPFDVTTILEAAQPEQISWGPGELTAPYCKMKLIANDGVDTADKLTVQAWISQIANSAQ